MAQVARVILLASAIVTSVSGLRCSIRASHEPLLIDLRANTDRRDMAPVISKDWISVWPAFDTRLSRSLPPEQSWRDMMPSQVAKSRRRLNPSIGGAKPLIAKAVCGPTLGIVCRRRAVSFAMERVLAFFVLAAIREVFLWIWSIRSRHSSRTSAGRSQLGSSRMPRLICAMPFGTK